MSGKKIAPCSLTQWMLTGKDCSSTGFIDFPEPLASLVFRYKLAIQYLQFQILTEKRDDLEEIGRCFEKLEIAIDRLIEYSVENH